MNEIKALYGGDFVPCEHFDSRTPKYVELSEQIEKKEQTLIAGLSDTQKELFKQIQDHYIELADIEETEMFEFAFRYSFKLATAIFNG